MSEREQQDAGGCIALVMAIVVIAVIVMAIISVAALLDPFQWLPPVGEIWADCDDTTTNCDLAARFPGFWVHVLVNLAYAVAAAAALGFLALAAKDAREAAQHRFDDAQAAKTYGERRRTFAAMVAAVLGLAVLPVVVVAIG